MKHLRKKNVPTCENKKKMLQLSPTSLHIIGENEKIIQKISLSVRCSASVWGGVHIQIERESAWGKHTERVCACVGYTCRVCHIQIERERVCHIQIERERVCHIQIKREREYFTYRKSMCVRWIHIQSMSHTDRERECVCGWDTHTDKESVCVGYTYR